MNSVLVTFYIDGKNIQYHNLKEEEFILVHGQLFLKQKTYDGKVWLRKIAHIMAVMAVRKQRQRRSGKGKYILLGHTASDWSLLTKPTS